MKSGQAEWKSLERPGALNLPTERDGPLYASANVHARARPAIYDFHAGAEVGMLVEGGELRIFADGTRLEIGPGEVWLHSMWEAHGHQILHANTRAVVLIFLPELLGEQLLGDLPWLTLFSVPPAQRPWVRDERTRARILELGRRLWTELEEQPVGWSTVAQYGLMWTLMELRRGWLTSEGAGARARELALVLPAISAVHADPKRWISLTEAAALVNLSQPYFSRLFRRSTGLGFHQFLLRARVIQAAQHIRSAQASVEDVAAEFGFADGPHLHRHFVKLYGCTPAEYRRRRDG